MMYAIIRDVDSALVRKNSTETSHVATQNIRERLGLVYSAAEKNSHTRCTDL